MRRWFVLLMIVLLPVRGWAGDAMGLHMALAGGNTVAAVHEMPADCPMHASSDTADTTDMAGMDHGDEAPVPQPHGTDGKCTTCQLCTAVAQLPVQPLLLSHAPAQAAPCSAGTDFASASLAPAVEPPIS